MRSAEPIVMAWVGEDRRMMLCYVQGKGIRKRKRRTLQFKEDYGIPDYTNIAGGRTAQTTQEVQTYGIKIMSYNLSLLTCLCLGLFSCLFRKVN